MRDEIPIKNKMRAVGTLNESASKLPPIGVNIRGVKAAIPLIPNRCQISTAYRMRLEKIFGFVVRYLAIKPKIAFPKVTIMVTVAIAPNHVNSTVSYHVKPRLNPVMGPAINFNPVAIITPE